jgi:hypothetical protein
MDFFTRDSISAASSSSVLGFYFDFLAASAFFNFNSSIIA